MKIAWFCIPAHGHTNPTLGLVKELTEAGHSIYYFSFEMFREKIEKAGAVFIPCDGYDFEMEDKENADRVGKDQAFAVELLVSSTLALDEMVTEKIAELQPDVIVADSVAYWGKLAAMKHGLPFISSTTTFAFNRYSSRYIFAVSLGVNPLNNIPTVSPSRSASTMSFMELSESNPSSYRSSKAPILSMPRTDSAALQIHSSISFSGFAYSADLTFKSGFGRSLRLSFPFSLSGILSSFIKCVGTM